MKKITKKKAFSFIMALSMIVTIPVGLSNNFAVKAEEKDVAEELQRQLIPLPLTYDVKEGKYTLTAQTMLYVQGRTEEETAKLHRIADLVAAKLRASSGYTLPIVDGVSLNEGHIFMTTVDSDESMGDEGYAISSNADGVVLSAYHPSGMFNATQTLRQLLPASIEKSEVVEGVSWDMPSVEIEDKPEYAFRSTMLDVSRHFFTVEQVKRHIDNVSQYKINKLHMHLSDDQGWRLEIKGEMEGENLSDLTTIGGSSSGDGWGGIRAGFYTQEDFQELVAYAADRNMEIIPEFDMPSHVNAAQASLAFLNKDGKKTELYHGIDVGWNSFDCNDERVYAFVDEVFKQVSAISPSKYIHIGGDEAHSTNQADYAKFMNRVTDIAKKYDKIPIGWQAYDNAIENGDDGISQYWATNGSALKKGMKHVVSPANLAYIDMKYPSGDMEYDIGLQWAAKISVKSAYSWDPTNFGTKDQIVGIEAPMWSETLTSDTSLDYLAYPRILGHAEIGWTPKDMRNWDEYKLRLKKHGERLNNQGIAYYKDQEVWEIPYIPVNAYWSLDEGKGNTIMDHTSTYQGTLMGDTAWISGKYGQAISFNGKGYVDLNIKDLKGDWTAAMWVKRGENGSTNAALLSGDEGEIKLEQWKNTQKVGLTKFGVEDITFNYSAPLHEWIHVAFVGNAQGTTLYVNGAYQDHTNLSIKGPGKRLGANAKANLQDSGNMVGSMDEVRIYNRALTDDEIVDLPNIEWEDTSFVKDILKKVIHKTEGFIADGKLETLAPSVISLINIRLQEAKAIYAKEDASVEACLEAWLQLANALQYLDFIADKTDLQTLIEACDLIDTADYIEGVEAFEAALNEAKAVLNDDTALQARIDAVYDHLLRAKDELILGTVDKAVLRSIVAKITATINDGTKYDHDEAWHVFVEALQNANAVLDNENASQEDVNRAFTAITKAYEDIRLLPDEALLQFLRDFITMVDATDLSRYSNEHVHTIMYARNRVMFALSNIDGMSETELKEIQNVIVDVIQMMQNVKLEDSSSSAEDVNAKVDISKNSNKGVTKPKTGDETNMLMMFGLLAASVSAVYFINKRRLNRS